MVVRCGREGKIDMQRFYNKSIDKNVPVPMYYYVLSVKEDYF